MNNKNKRMLIFIVIVIVVAMLIHFVFSILSSLSWFAIAVAAIIVYWQWPNIKKMI